MALFKSKIGKWSAMAGFMALVVVISTYAYVHVAFPETRCEAEHLEDKTKMAGDCYACHVKTTPQVAQDWYEGKHGVLLVKCFVCHGQPDGDGAVEFAVDPDPDKVCRKCHDPAVNRMEAKFGLRPDCNSCHPYHQNSIHHDAYQKTESKKALD
jgi:hypothetical protein